MPGSTRSCTKTMPAGDLGRHVGARRRLADQRVLGGSFQRRLRIHLDVESAPADQRGHADAAAVGSAHFAVDECELLDRPLQRLRSHRQQRLAGGGRGLAQLDPAAHHAAAAGRRALVGRQRAVAFDQLDAVDADAEFLADHLAHRDAVPGAQVDLAREHDHRAVGADGEEGVELVERQCRPRCGRRAGRLRQHAGRRGEGKTDHQGAGFEPFAPGQQRSVG